MLNRNTLASFSMLVLFCTNVQASPNLLTNSWLSCENNNRTRNTGSTVQLNSECLYQEVAAQQNDQLNLLCDARTNDFTSVQLTYSDQNFRALRSGIDSTSSNQTLQVSAGSAPRNTRYAVATIFANRSATLICSLSTPNPVQTAPLQTAVVGPCIDSNNDGFGWNGVDTCTPPDTQPPTPIPVAPPAQTPVAGVCVDSDNDGYGWNGVDTCTVPSTQNNNQSIVQNSSNTRTIQQTTPQISGQSRITPNIPGPCIDSDNDGFGWNGVDSCVVPASNSATASNSSNTQSNTINSNSENQVSGPPTGTDLTDLVLVTGQSNAQGGKSDVSLAVLDAPNNKVFAFTDESGWQVADLRQHWDGPLEIRHPGGNALIFPTNTPHNNFAIHFGKSLVAIDPQRVVGFVLATAPGAGIKHWNKGSSFYNTLSTKAMTALNASNKTSFDAILWHQGETDFVYNGTSDINATRAEKFAPNYYPDKLYTLISNLRQEPWFTTARPVFICGETQKTNPDPVTIAPVNRRLMALNNDSDRYTACVGSDGLQTTDGTHFNAAALREIGKRYATKYIELKRR